jgi:hypothetical protein
VPYSSDVGGPDPLSPREQAESAAIAPALEALARKLEGRQDIAAAIAKLAIPPEPGSSSSSSQVDLRSLQPGREGAPRAVGGAPARPRSAAEIRSMLVSLTLEDGHSQRARELFGTGRDAAPALGPAPPAPPSPTLAPASLHGTSSRSLSADSRPSAMGSCSVGNAAWDRAGRRSL